MAFFGKIGWRRCVMLMGFVAAFCGDWLLAVKCSPPKSGGFLGGIVAFACAHLLWAAAHLRMARPDIRALALAGIPLVLFSAVRVSPVLPKATGLAVVAYAAITAFDFSVAVATRRRLYVWGVALLGFSDVLIGMNLAHVPGCAVLIGPSYIAAETCLLASCARRDGAGRTWSDMQLAPLAVWTAFGALFAFTLAMAVYPGGAYNPCMRMLSALGRTRTPTVDYPLSHYLFMLGMAISAAGIARIGAGIRAIPRFAARAFNCFRLGAALNAAGLASIALIPEDVNMDFHNAGCWIAVIGGLFMVFAVRRQGWRDTAWKIHLLCTVLALGGFTALHALKITPFAPWVTTTQKLVIASFMAWCVSLTRPVMSRRTLRLVVALAIVWLLLALAAA